MRARLAPDTVGSAGVRLVVKPAYAWVGNTTMTADAWTTVTGTYTVPADADPATLQVYIGTGALDGPYTYLVDDLTITAPAGGEEPADAGRPARRRAQPDDDPGQRAQGTGNRSALTFDDGPNGADTTELLDFLAAEGHPRHVLRHRPERPGRGRRGHPEADRRRRSHAVQPRHVLRRARRHAGGGRGRTWPTT